MPDGVGVEVVVLFKSIINCGECTLDSREARLIAVAPAVESPKLYVPDPIT